MANFPQTDSEWILALEQLLITARAKEDWQQVSYVYQSLAAVRASQQGGSVAGGPYPTTNGSIATAATAQEASTEKPRQAIEIQNQSAGDLWFRFDGTAAQNTGLFLGSGQAWQNPGGFAPSGPLSIWGATAGQAFAVTEG
jgi:hypothetical protein